mmetsp:Transcript_44460/g.94736  ORF Transcript_44460/g.94736 Transcript_44460/m.94736 type:complete len:263 (+) Transcript_44460:2-790(+)
MYKANQYCGPLRGLSKAEVRECREGLERFMEDHCGGVMNHSNTLQHFATLPWLYRMATHPRLVGAVRSVLQCDEVSLFSSCFFIRDAGQSCKSQLGVGWHEDGVLYKQVLSPMTDWVTAFVALSPCRRKDGCLQYAAHGCQANGGKDPPHRQMQLRAGEFCLHGSTITHRAGTNSMNRRRLCVALRYISGRVRDVVAEADPKAPRDWAVPCPPHYTNGPTFTNGHFLAVPAPVQELGKVELSQREEIATLRAKRYGQISIGQ